MARRLIVWLALLVAAILTMAPLRAENAATDPARIIAVGDLHGDFGAWRAIAEAAGLIDGKGSWAGSATTLVQLGDMTDRGPDSLRIIRDLQRLEREAANAGGKVVVVLGNHEAMNVIGDLRYVHPGEYAAFADRQSERRREATWRANRERLEAAYAALDPPVQPEDAKRAWFEVTPLGKLEHRRAWAPGGELATWAATRPAVVKIGQVLFVHGGLSSERGMEPIAAINARIATALAPGDAVDRSVLEDPLGPLWYRGHLTRTAEEATRPPQQDELAAVLAYHGASRLVVGHTPAVAGIKESLGGRLIQVDTGISAHYGGPASFLEIAGGRVVAHQRNKDGTWTSRELPTVGEGEQP
ncbi:MAG: metallophosphoesterase [Erythrobacter sp.]